MYRDHKITVVIPCLNEEEGIRMVLERIPRFVDEVIVVDNGSTDDTAQIAARLGARVIREDVRGYGRAYKTGLLHAQGDIIVTLDGDHSYPADSLSYLIEALIGSDRKMLDSRRAWVVVSLVGLLGSSLGVSPHLRPNLVRFVVRGSEQQTPVAGSCLNRGHVYAATFRIWSVRWPLKRSQETGGYSRAISGHDRPLGRASCTGHAAWWIPRRRQDDGDQRSVGHNRPTDRSARQRCR